MRVGFRIVRYVIAHHQRQRGDVQSTCGDVGGHQHRAAAIGEAHQHFIAIALVHVAMQGERGKAAAVELLCDRIHFATHVAEHQCMFGTIATQQLRQRVHLLRRLYFVEALLDCRLLIDGCIHRYFDRLALHTLAHCTDLLRIRRREQQRLMMLGDAPHDVVDRLAETHVEHAVRLVQHQHLDAAAVQAPALQVFLHPPRRTDHDMRVVRQRRQLRSQWHATTQRQQLHVRDIRRQLADRLADLVGKFAGRAQHQGLQPDRVGVECLQQAQPECGGLATTGLRLRDDITTGQHRRQTLRLHRRHFGIAERFEAGEQGGFEREGVEGVHLHMIA